MIGIGATLFKRMAGGSRFSPASLFSGGEAGVWFDPSDSRTLLRTETGTDGYLPSVIGEPVALMFDKSQSLTRDVELVTNGDFAQDSNWSKGAGWTIAGGQAVATNISNKNLTQGNLGLQDMATYQITFTMTRTAGSLVVRFGGTTVVDHEPIEQSGAYTVYLTANNSNDSIVMRGKNGFTGTVDNVSVRRVLGNHAIQATSANQPIYARNPERGAVNLLEYTEQFDNSDWDTGTNSTLTANYAASPVGTQTADRLELPTLSSTFTRQLAFITSGKTYTLSVYVKATSGTSSFTIFDTATGSTVDSGTQTATSEWQRFTLTTTATVSGSHYYGISNGDDSYASDILIWGAQVEEASGATNYQKVVSQYDVTEAGMPSVHYLDFDGTSDSMAIEGLTSSSTPITAFFGYSSTTASGTFNYLLDIEVGRTIFCASGNVANQPGYYDGAFSTFAADANALKVLSYEVIENDAKVRIDGVQEYSDTTYDQHAIGGNIGLFSSNNGASSYTRGHMYQTILRAAESTDAEIAKTETFVAKKTGITL